MTGHADRGPSRDPAATGVRRRFSRAGWDSQPTQEAAVLIASTGDPIPLGTIRTAVRRSGGEPVAVVSIARIHGYQLGLPNPGLMPTRGELAAQRDQAHRALTEIERSGVVGWAQVATTRHPAKAISTAARARGVRLVLVVAPITPGWRRLLEGDLVKEITRRVPAGTSVERITT